MKKSRRALVILLTVAMVFCYMPGLAFAETEAAASNSFVDMPNDWSTAALESAVANGLIKGYESEEGMLIKPAGTLTRAELATIVNRSFGATEKASLKLATDVPATAWFAPEIQKAVKMGTFKDDTLMRPNDNITRQEAFVVLARAFKAVDSDKSGALSQFSDSAAIATWAQDGICALVDKAYVSGSNGMINPKANITRAEFAKIMDSMVKSYITAAGTVTQAPASGNVMINAAGVTLKDVTVNGNVIVGDGVGTGTVSLENVVVKGDVIARGGGVNSLIIKGGSVSGEVIVAKVDGNIRVSVEGGANVAVIVVADGKDDVIVEGKVGTLNVEGAVPVMIQNATIQTVNVDSAGADVTVAKGATVATLTMTAKAEVAVAGTVTKLDVAASAGGSSVDIAKDAKVGTLNTAADITKTGTGKADAVTGSGTVTDGKKEEPPVAGGGGGGSSSGGTAPPTPTIAIASIKATSGGSNLSPGSDGAYDLSGGSKDTAAVTVNINSLADVAYSAKLTIKNGSTTVAEAETSGLEKKYLAALSGTEVTFSDIGRMFDRIGTASGWYIDASGNPQAVQSGQAAFESAINAMFTRMGASDIYTVTIELTPTGGSAGTATIKVKKV